MYNIIANDVFSMMDAFMNYKAPSIQNQGLKNIINRPHNLININDKDGKLTAQRLEVVTTPFKKDEVSVTINNKNGVLTVKCGFENKKDKEDENFVFKGISSQTYEFSLKLPNNIDKSKISAENKDGILKVTLPIMETEETDNILSVNIA